MAAPNLPDAVIEYDDADGAYRVQLEACPGDAPSIAVVALVGTLEGVPSADLAPLYDSVDPEALDSLHESLVGSDAGSTVVFPYAGYEITVTAAAIAARPVDE
ncbi:HalOD1 output domain-containing protein [Natronoarchaeum rubrum]|uniref:HalOD1 output domain-containing protein n=1 Tax=Natronoarchaeum rubrum TaxID=755311 RepID=UPI0021121BE3|nr:HalOD1 output domain-containing protein [Natronoarchaeum rubrum]HMB49043.1 HalOD1 output domain-containing protein [Natronoarchaeum rubrum]